MNSEADPIDTQKLINEALTDLDANSRLLQFVKILAQINEREKVFTYDPKNHFTL